MTARRPKRTVALLGPQRLDPTAADILETLAAAKGPVAVVTAGWEERESEDDELAEHLGRETINLTLYARSEDVLERDDELAEALRERRRRHEALQRFYRLRLRHLAPAAEAVLAQSGPDELVEPERAAAFEDLRRLDERHLRRVEALEREFERGWSPAGRAVVEEHRREIASRLEGAAALCIAGGHVRVLLTRLRLFGVVAALPAALPIVAWSAGAMTLTDRVVLFHDNPPQGRSHAEVLGPGLGLCPGLVALPHARRRLHLDDPLRVGMLVRRFPDAVCAALDEGTGLAWDERRWTAIRPTKRLTDRGQLAAVAGGGQ